MNSVTHIRVILPYALQTLAHCEARVDLELQAGEPVTQLSIIRALEQRYPALSGAIFEHGSNQRRPLLRFFAGQEDLSFLAPDAPLPDGVVSGRDEFIIVGAIAGG